MKKIFILLIVSFLSIQGIAQNNYTTYDTCQYLNQYQAEWMYANNQDTIRIYLRAHRDYSSPLNWVGDKLYGWLEYKSGNTIIESTYAHRNDPLPYLTESTDSMNVNLKSLSLMLKGCDNNSPTLMGTIIDHLQSNEIHVVTAKLDATKTVMTWEQHHREGYGFGTGATGMTLPKQFILIKQ